MIVDPDSFSAVIACVIAGLLLGVPVAWVCAWLTHLLQVDP